MILVCGHLAQYRVTLSIQRRYRQVVTLDDALKLLDHSLRMRLCIPLIVSEVVDIVRVARPIHFHRLQELDELTEVWLPIDT